MKKLFLAIIAISFMGMMSCNEEFTVNERPDVQDLEAFFQKEANVESAVIGIYDLMQQNYSVPWHSAFFVKILPGDDANAAGGNSGDQPQLQDIDDYTNVSVSNPSITNVWDLFYRTIALSNLVITNIEGSSLSNKERAIAEAKFMRAWCYFELTTMFGDIPLRLTVPTTADEFGLKKSTRAEIYAQIESDLTAAVAGLPEKGASDNFRASRGTAQALMGKVLVFQEKYAASLPFFEAVISNPSHDLEPNVEDVWSIDKEFGVESLFELGYISTTARDWGNITWGGNNESNLHIQLMGPRGDGIFDVSSVGLLNGWGFNLPTSKLANAFEAAGDVDRKNATLMTEADLIAAGGDVDQSAAVGGEVWDYEGAIRIKYATKLEDTSDGVAELNYSTNWRVLRYAEVLLLAAEAYNMSGNDGSARAQLDKVRMRSNLAAVDVTLSGNALFEAIVNEKFLELAHEGQRFWDLVRWGKAAAELAGTGYSSKNDLFPIPITEIEKNSELSEADQNPGY